jgi:hypothetical protein
VARQQLLDTSAHRGQGTSVASRGREGQAAGAEEEEEEPLLQRRFVSRAE